jgi:CBS domain-containing protein
VISLSTIAKLASRGHAGTIAAALARREADAPAPFPAALERRALEEVTCREIMSDGVECSSLGDPVRTVAVLMRCRNIGFVPVCDDEGRAVGTLTDRDLALRVVAELRAAERTRSVDVLTPELVCCAPEDPLRLAEELMVQFKKSRIVIVDDERQPRGVISLSDIARVERAGRVTRVLRDVSSRAGSHAGDDALQAPLGGGAAGGSGSVAHAPRF